MKNRRLTALLCAGLLAWRLAPAAEFADDAARFGALELAREVSLSPDGKRLAFVSSAANGDSIAVVADLVAGGVKAVLTADGKPFHLRMCDWSAVDRLVCVARGVVVTQGVRAPVSRILAVNADGGSVLPLGQRDSTEQLYIRQFDGYIVDWLNGIDGNVLMARNYVPEKSTGRHTARTESGLGVELVDTRTGRGMPVERPEDDAVGYISDGQGTVRIRTLSLKDPVGLLRGIYHHAYRTKNSRDWQPLGARGADGDFMTPLAVDPLIDAAYVLRPLDGHRALYRIALDGSLRTELVFTPPNVDVEEVVRVGRGGRVIGATFVTDRHQVHYFDPAYREIAATVAKSLPQLPQLQFVGSSADEQLLLIRASSDVDPGHYYLFNRANQTLTDILQARPPLRAFRLTAAKSVWYTTADGARIAAYLTLPPGVTDPHGLPAIVMPHGGSQSRDDWGFDWLAHFFAQRGYVVLQPKFRGTVDYGEDWVAINGYRNWKLAVGDICDGARWLVSQGIADRTKLAVVGWSYGGYAALQSNVLDPDLFKAVVAIAPVTDLAQLKDEARDYTSGQLVARFIGTGPVVDEGSPAEHAEVFKAPVLMFHGDADYYTSVAQSRVMDRALRSKSKSSTLVVYPQLTHSLPDGSARADLLRRSDAFLRTALQLPAP